MNTHTAIFDHWIRTEFVTLNSELEQLYWQQTDKANVEGRGLKATIRKRRQRIN